MQPASMQPPRSASVPSTQVGGLSEIGSLLLFELSELSPLHAELIGALSARFTVDAIVGLTGVTDLDERAYMLAQRLLPAASVTHPRPTPASITRLVTATDSDDEVRCVLREVMALAESGVAFDRIAVLYTSGDPYARILREQLAAAAIPHYGPGIRRLGDSVTGRTLRSLLALDSTNLARGALIDLLSAAPLTFQGATIPTTAWDQLSRQAGVVRGADDWHRKLHAYRAVLAQRGRDLSGDDSSAGRLAHNRRQIEQLDSLAAFVTQLAADLAPEPAPCHWRDFAEWSDGLLRRYLDSSGVASAPAEKEWPSREREAYDAVREVLRLIASLDQLQPEPTLEQFVLTVLAELDTANDRIGRSGEGVLFGPTFLAPGLDVDAVFVVGVAEGFCPAIRREDSLLSDHDRDLAAFGELATRGNRVVQEHRSLLAALSAGRLSRVASYPRGDGRTGRTRWASRWLVELVRECTGEIVTTETIGEMKHDRVLNYASFRDGLRQAATWVSLADRDLRLLDRHHDLGRDVRSHHLAGEPTLSRGFAMIDARLSETFTRFDGKVDPELVAGRTTAAVLSPSRLESWASCPRRYFLGDVLRLGELERPDEILSISALDRGSLMHAVLEQFVQENITHGPDAPVEYSRLVAIAREVMADYETRGLTGRPVLWQLAKREILLDLAEFCVQDQWLRQTRRAVPRAVELSFGLDGEPPAVIALSDGRRLSFRGRIDRVDCVGGDDGASVSRALVFDYKTGTKISYDPAIDPVGGGTQLQLPIYAAAVAHRFGVDEVEVYYWATRNNSKLHGGIIDAAGQQRVHDTLALVTDGIEKGIFPAFPSGWSSHFNTHDNCRYCDFDRLCPRDRGTHWEAIKDSPELISFVTLRGLVDPAAVDGVDDGEATP